jgi:hypothetical protein
MDVSCDIRVALISLQGLAPTIAPETRNQDNVTGADMKHSNLADRLEQFAVEEREALRAHSAPRLLPAVPATASRAPRRRNLTDRRIQIRDSGLTHFRVF